MVLLTVTPDAKAALDEYCQLKTVSANNGLASELHSLSELEIGSSIEHHDLVSVSSYLVQHAHSTSGADRKWRLDTLLKGAAIHQPPPPAKKEPVSRGSLSAARHILTHLKSSEYKALMQRLRKEEEQRQYERMVNPPAQRETFSQRFPGAASPFAVSTAADEIDEVTYADVNRQMILIINVLVSIICTSVAVWLAARRWTVVSRLLLAFTSSTVVAVAEVVIYMGYIRRIKESRDTERKIVEEKQVVDTWVIDGKSTSQQINSSDSMRFRKGKHR